MHSFDDVPQPKKYTFDPTEEPIADDEHAENLLELAEIHTKKTNLRTQYFTGFCMTSWDFDHEMSLLDQAERYFEHRIDTYNRQRLMHSGRAAVERFLADIRKS
jgi:hypothetical protein